MSVADNCEAAMNKLMAAGILDSYRKENGKFSYVLTQKGRELRSSLQKEGQSTGLGPLDLAQIAYGLHFDENEQQGLSTITLNIFEINGRDYASPMIPVIEDKLYRAGCPFCPSKRPYMYLVTVEKTFFCMECGARGKYTPKGSVTRRVAKGGALGASSN